MNNENQEIVRTWLLDISQIQDVSILQWHVQNFLNAAYKKEPKFINQVKFVGSFCRNLTKPTES